MEAMPPKIAWCPRCQDAPLIALNGALAGEWFIPGCICNPGGQWTPEEIARIEEYAAPGTQPYRVPPLI